MPKFIIQKATLPGSNPEVEKPQRERSGRFESIPEFFEGGEIAGE